MGAFRPLAIVRDYGELHEACRAYVDELNVSRMVIDEVAGLHSGYASKILAPSQQKRFGMVSLGPFLQSMGLVLIVAQDVDGLALMRHRLPERDLKQVRHQSPRK